MKTLLSFLLTIYASLLFGQVFTEITSSPLEGVRDGASEMADVNGDGFLDILIIGSNSNTAPVANLYLNDGAGNFIESTNDEIVGVQRGDVIFGDVDNDGDNDLIAAGIPNTWTRMCRLYTNSGTGDFPLPIEDEFKPTEGCKFALADIDNDQDLDLLVTGEEPNVGSTIELYTNDGAGNFSETVTTAFTVVSNGRPVFTDVDLDGDKDIIISGYTSNSSSTNLYLNDGQGVYSDASNEEPFKAKYYSSVEVGDVDGDGDEDLFLADVNDSKLYLNDGSGNFQEVTGTPFDRIRNGYAKFGDIDGDNDLDIVMVGDNPDSLIAKIYLNDSNGNFEELLDTPFEGTVKGDLTLGDIDNDGDLDVLIVGENENNKLISKIYRNNLEPITQCPPPGDYRLPTQADVDDFLMMYPNCEEIDGHLTIGEYIQPSSTDIHDLSGFISLKRVTGDLRLRQLEGVEEFDGLQNIEFVGGDFYIEGNDILRNLKKLEKLDSINGEFLIQNNSSLDSLFDSSTINHIGGATLIIQNVELKSVEGFRNLTTLNSLEISNCSSVTNLNGFNSVSLINGRLLLFNTGLSDLSELSNLQQIQGQGAISGLNINGNFLNSLEGLNNLISIEGALIISNNPNLTNLSKLESLNFIGGYVQISNCLMMTDISGLENAALGFGGIEINNNRFLSSIEQLKINSVVSGDVRVTDNRNLLDISSLATIDSIYGGLSISKNDLLSNCESVCQLLNEGYVEGLVSISSNLSGCNSIDEITSQNCITINTEDLLKENSMLTVFPNPVSDELNVNFITRPYAISNTILYNSLGQIIKEEVLENRLGSQTIDMRAYRSGLYFLVIKTEKGSVVKRIVKSN